MELQIGAVIGAIVAGLVVSLVAYLARDKQMRIEEKIDRLADNFAQLAQKVEQYEARNRKRHEITLEWLYRITEESEDVEKPEEIVTDIDFSFDDPDVDGETLMRGGSTKSADGGQKQSD